MTLASLPNDYAFIRLHKNDSAIRLHKKDLAEILLQYGLLEYFSEVFTYNYPCRG